MIAMLYHAGGVAGEVTETESQRNCKYVLSQRMFGSFQSLITRLNNEDDNHMNNVFGKQALDDSDIYIYMILL